MLNSLHKNSRLSAGAKCKRAVAPKKVAFEWALGTTTAEKTFVFGKHAGKAHETPEMTKVIPVGRDSRRAESLAQKRPFVLVLPLVEATGCQSNNCSLQAAFQALPYLCNRWNAGSKALNKTAVFFSFQSRLLALRRSSLKLGGYPIETDLLATVNAGLQTFYFTLKDLVEGLTGLMALTDASGNLFGIFFVVIKA